MGDNLELKERFIEKIMEIPKSHTFKTKKKNLIGFWFEGIEGEALSLILKDAGIEASTESPCIKEYKKDEKLTHEQAHGSLIIKWKEFDKEEINRIVNEIKKGVAKLRKISGWK